MLITATLQGRSKEDFQLTVTCPFGVSGGSHVIIIIDALNGRTCTLRGALSISIFDVVVTERKTEREREQTQKEKKTHTKRSKINIEMENRLMEQLHGSKNFK